MQAEVLKGDFYPSDGSWEFSRKMQVAVGWFGESPADFGFFLDGYTFAACSWLVNFLFLVWGVF